MRGSTTRSLLLNPKGFNYIVLHIKGILKILKCQKVIWFIRPKANSAISLENKIS